MSVSEFWQLQAWELNIVFDAYSDDLKSEHEMGTRRLVQQAWWNSYCVWQKKLPPLKQLMAEMFPTKLTPEQLDERAKEHERLVLKLGSEFRKAR